MEKFDLVILGAGPGGYTAAIRAAQLGMKTAIVEKDAPGGTCLNRGCIPTKCLADLAHTIEKARRSAARGVSFGKPEVDMARVTAGKDKVVATLGAGIASLLKSNGVTLVPGEGKLTAGRAVSAGDRTLEAPAVILAPGARPARPRAFPFGKGRYLTSDEILTLEERPDSLAVVGGGFIGCEFASIFASLGARVSIHEMLPRLLPLEDEEVSTALERAFRKMRIAVTTGRAAAREELDKADIVLVAIGREPATDGLGLDEAGVARDEKGFIRTGENLETSVPGVFAIGDAAGKGQLAYIASAQAVSVVEGLRGRTVPVPYEFSPNCVFTNPEVGTFGLRESDIKDPDGYLVGKFPFAALGKARCLDETDGFVKIIAEKRSGRVAGCQVVGPGAADLVHIAAVAAAAEGTIETVAEAIFGHPTLAESIKEAAEAAMGRAIHLPPAGAG